MTRRIAVVVVAVLSLLGGFLIGNRTAASKPAPAVAQPAPVSFIVFRVNVAREGARLALCVRRGNADFELYAITTLIPGHWIDTDGGLQSRRLLDGHEKTDA